MAMIQGIDGNALIQALRAGKEDRYRDDKRAMDAETWKAEQEAAKQKRGLMGQLFSGGEGVSGQYASSQPVQSAQTSFGEAFSAPAMDAIGSGQEAPPVSMGQPAPTMQPAQQAPRRVNQDVLRQLIVLDPETGGKIATALKTLDENTLKQLEFRNSYMGAAARYVQQGASPEERLQRFQISVPQLLQAGWTPQELDKVDNDLSDQRLGYFQATAIDYDKMIDNELAEREFQAGKTVPVTAGGNVAIVKPDGSAKWAIGGGKQSDGIPQGAVDHLKQNPALKAAFDEKYGAGAADKVLGGGVSNGTGGFRP